MIRFELSIPDDRPLEILCLGAHCDDIEIGCGGTLLRILGDRTDVICTWAVFSGDDHRERELRESAASFLKGAGRIQVENFRLRDGYLPYCGGETKDAFEQLKSRVEPDLIFTHFREDAHQDHRLVGELTWNTFRNHMILEYEIPKYDGDLARPHTYFEVSEDLCRRKIEFLMRHYSSQAGKDWFCEETFRAIMRMRGMECRSASGYAEAFFAAKIVV